MPNTALAAVPSKAVKPSFPRNEEFDAASAMMAPVTPKY